MLTTQIYLKDKVNKVLCAMVHGGPEQLLKSALPQQS